MKIGFDPMPATAPATYSRHLARLLAEYAPQHEYVFDGKMDRDMDVYHSFRFPLPLFIPFRGIRTVVTVPNLNFLRHPDMYTLFDRLVRIRLYKRSCRSANCLIAMNKMAKEELSERLGIDERKIRVVMPLAVHPPGGACDESGFEVIRRKYSLPDRFVLSSGPLESRHNQLDVLEALLEMNDDTGLVVCGRRSGYSDFLLGYARKAGAASRVVFIYEPSPADLPALFRMAQAFVAVPDAGAEASLRPVVEALRAGVPMVLSDLPLHREAAADAAVYVHPGDADRLSEALGCVLGDADFRRSLAARERVRAEAFSEYAVVRRLIDIYSSL